MRISNFQLIQKLIGLFLLAGLISCTPQQTPSSNHFAIVTQLNDPEESCCIINDWGEFHEYIPMAKQNYLYNLDTGETTLLKGAIRNRFIFNALASNMASGNWRDDHRFVYKYEHELIEYDIRKQQESAFFSADETIQNFRVAYNLEMYALTYGNTVQVNRFKNKKLCTFYYAQSVHNHIFLDGFSPDGRYLSVWYIMEPPGFEHLIGDNNYEQWLEYSDTMDQGGQFIQVVDVNTCEIVHTRKTNWNYSVFTQWLDNQSLAIMEQKGALTMAGFADRVRSQNPAFAKQITIITPLGAEIENYELEDFTRVRWLADKNWAILQYSDNAIINEDNTKAYRSNIQILNRRERSITPWKYNYDSIAYIFPYSYGNGQEFILVNSDWIRCFKDDESLCGISRYPGAFLASVEKGIIQKFSGFAMYDMPGN